MRVEEVRDAAELPGALGRVARDVEAFWALPDTGLWTPGNRDAFVRLARDRGAPCLGPDEGFVELGALMSVRPPHDLLGARLAEIARSILYEGAAAESVPIVPAGRVAGVLNLATAEALGLKLSEEVLQGAARLVGGTQPAAP